MWDWIVAYLIPTPVYWWWTDKIWIPLRFGPVKGDACDDCPYCKKQKGT